MSRAVLVISFEEDSPERLSEVMDQVRAGIDLNSLKDVKIYAGIHEVAEEVLTVFKDLE